MTVSERQRAAERFPRSSTNRLLVTRQHVLEEYDLADLILVLSEKARSTFTVLGFPEEKLFKLERGVDVARFRPGTPPDMFRAIFVGALIKRKGVHHLLDVWHRLNLPNAELWLVGRVHEEIKPYLREFASKSVKLHGFVPNIETCYPQCAVHVFPSSCEGSAKTLYEAAASGLPQITTRESGDQVIDGRNGLIIPPDDTEALAEAILKLYHDRDLAARQGREGRRLMEENYTWEHFRDRLLQAYALACGGSYEIGKSPAEAQRRGDHEHDRE